MPRPQKPLPARSARQMATSKAISAACPLGPDARCAACGARQGLSRSHVLTRKQFPQHAANPANLVVLCIHPCHATWEDKKLLFRQLHPQVWALKMAAIRQLEPSYYAFFLAKLNLPD
jgi:ribosomal protein S14